MSNRLGKTFKGAFLLSKSKGKGLASTLRDCLGNFLVISCKGFLLSSGTFCSL